MCILILPALQYNILNVRLSIYSSNLFSGFIGFAFFHDFAITENYHIFNLPPLDFQPLPFVLGRKVCHKKNFLRLFLLMHMNIILVPMVIRSIIIITIIIVLILRILLMLSHFSLI